MDIIVLGILLALTGVLALGRVRLIWGGLAYVAFIGAAFAIWHTSVGLPRAVGWRTDTQGHILAYQIAEKRAIFVWIVPDNGRDPLYLSLPWSERRAAELHDVAKRAAKKHLSLRMRREQANMDAGQRSRQHMFFASRNRALPNKTSRFTTKAQ